MDIVLHKILALLWENNVSEQDFCAAIGINKSAVTDWKKGKTSSYKRHLSKISEYFNVPESYFTAEKETAQEGQPLSEDFEELKIEFEDLSPEEIKDVRSYVAFLKQKRST